MVIGKQDLHLFRIFLYFTKVFGVNKQWMKGLLLSLLERANFLSLIRSYGSELSANISNQ